MEIGAPARAAMKSRTMIEVAVPVEVPMPVIDESRTVGNISVVVVDDVVVVPVGIPVVPSPAKAGVETHPKAQPKRNPRTDGVEPAIGDPARIDYQRRPIDNPGIVYRHVNDLWICRLNDDCLPLSYDLFLRCAL